MTNSRDKWKSRAKKAEQRIKQLEKQLEKQQQTSKSSSQSSPILTKTTEELLRARGHYYTVKTIQLSVQQVMEAGNSYRGVATTMELLNQNTSTNSPHFSSIRSWLGRIGLYALNRDKEKRPDWILIVDLTLELGKEKAMVVYGISEQDWQQQILPQKRGLRHTDGEILKIEVTTTATGEFIQEQLENLTNKIGVPRQILADHGSNLKKGIKLYQQDHPEVIYTYDVTHAMAMILKQQLNRNLVG